MNCPNCKCKNISTIDSRPSKKMIRRRKQCDSCGHRFSTYEISKSLLEYYENQLNRLKELERYQRRSRKDEFFKRPWTKSELDLLLLMYFEQSSSREIAEALDRTLASVENKLHQLRVKGKLKIS